MKKILVLGLITLIAISLTSPVQARLFSDTFDFLFGTQSEQPTIIKISPSLQNVSFGDTFSINIVIEPSTPIAGAQLNLQFNPSLVRVDEVAGGNLFTQNGASTIFSQGTTDNDNGIINQVWGNVLGIGENVSRSGTFATIHLTAIAQGVSQLNLITVDAISVKISDPNGDPVPIEIENGTINIGAITTLYGNGWKEIHYADGSVSHTEGIRTFKRWDGVWRPRSEWGTGYTSREGELIADGGSFKSIFYQHKNTIITDKFRFSQQPTALHFLNIATKAHTKILDASAASQITMHGNKLVYEDVYPNVDYKFTYDGFKLKEDIVSHRTNYPASPYPLDKTYLVFSTKLWEFSGIRKLIDDDGEITGNKDVKGILKLKNINEDVLSYLPIGDASSLFVNQTCYNETSEEHYICNQTKTTKVHNRLIKVSGTWYLFSGINYAWVKDVNRIGDITIDPTWVVGSGGNAWSGNVSYDGTTEVQSTGDVELRREVDDYVSYWRMDKGSGNAAYDENTTNTNDGSFTDGSTGNWTSSSKYGDYALDFDGTDDYVNCGDDASLNISNGEHTIIAWVNPSTIPSNTEWHHRVVNKGDAVYWWNMDILRLSATTAKFEMVWDDDVVKKIASANGAFTLNTWYQVIGRRKGTEYALFINGIKQTDTETVGNNFTAPNNIYIGKKNYGDAEYFEGIIDEVRIYNRALSNDEINQTMDNEHKTEGNLTSWHDAGGGNETYKLSVNFTFPANTNASINLYNNDTGAFIETLATNNNTEQWSKTITSPVQDSKINITLYGNVTETPESHNITFHTQSSAAADTSFTVTLPSGYTYAEFEPPNSTAQNVTPNGQSASQEFYNITNTGNVNLDVRLKLQPEQNQSAYWSMDEGVGSWVNDTSGNNNNGTWYGNTTANWTADTPFGTGYALDFDGVNDYVDCGSDPSLNNTDIISVEGWVNGTVTGDNQNDQAGIATTAGYKLEVNSGGNGEFFFKVYTASGQSPMAIGTTIPNANEWYHIVGQYTGSKIQIYVNGILEDEESRTGTINVFSNLLIGKNGAGANRYFNGIIDEVRIYDRVLNSTEIYAHYKNWFNQTPYNTILKADTDNNPTGATEINTTLQTFYSGLTPNSYADIWLWSDFNHTPQQATNRTLSINVTQS